VEGTYRVTQMTDGAKVIDGVFDFDRTKYDIKFRSSKFFNNLGDKLISDEVVIGFQIRV
jgi:hypothetical protein